MISQAEALKSNEFVKRRILRLQQVREQSKECAKKIRCRVENERGKVNRNINKEKGNIKRGHIEHLQSQLAEGLSQIGSSHSNAVIEDILNKEWEVRKKHNYDKTVGKERLHKPSLSSVVNNLPPSSNTEIHKKLTIEEDFGEKGCAKTNNTCVERGGGDFVSKSNVTANYFEVSPQEENNDALHTFCPTETIRQLRLSEQATNTIRPGTNCGDSVANDAKDNMNDYCYKSTISDYIKSRPSSSLHSKLDSDVYVDLSDAPAAKDVFDHTKTAPPLAPSIPKLPTGYKKDEESPNNVDSKTKDVKRFGKYLSPHHKADRKQDCPTCLCTKGKHRDIFKPNLRQTLKAQSSRRIVTCNPGEAPKSTKVVTRCKEAPKSSSHTSVGCSDRPVRGSATKNIKCFDEAIKTEHQTKPGSEYLVERLIKVGESAFELAQEENRGAAVLQRQKVEQEQARQVRGLAAREKLLKEREYQNIIKVIDECERKRIGSNRKILAEVHPSAGREKQNYQNEQRKMEQMYENIEQQCRVNFHPEPVVSHSQRLSPEANSCEASKGKLHQQRKSNVPVAQPSVVNVGDWNRIPHSNQDTSHNNSDSESMGMNRVLNLIEKQKEQLIKEVARMESLKKLKPKKHRKHKQAVCDNQQNSTADEAQPTTDKKRSLKIRKELASGSAHSGGDYLRSSANTGNGQQLMSNGSHTSISFQGFQIVVEVKSASQSNVKDTIHKNEKYVQTTKSLVESQDSSTEVSIKTSKVTTEKIVIESDNIKMRSNYVDSSASTSYMSPPEKFTRQAAETYFAKRTILQNTETQTDTFTENKSCPPHIKDANLRNRIEKPQESLTKGKARNKKNCGLSGNIIANKLPDSCQVGRVLQTPSCGNYDKSATSNKLNPKIKTYVHKLLNLANTGLHNIEIDVSDVPTPTSSVINVASNEADYNEKIEKIKCFIDDNYSLIEQLEKQNKFHQQYKGSSKSEEGSSAESTTMSVKVDNTVFSRKVKPKSKQKGHLKATKFTCKQDKGESPQLWKPSENILEATDTDASRTNQQTDLNIKKDKTNENYDKLSYECSQKIVTLSEKLEKVRKDKQTTLSSNSSDEDLSNIDKFVPILMDIPKPSNYFNSDLPASKSAPNFSITSDAKSLPALEQVTDPLGRRPRPPVAMYTNPIMNQAQVNHGPPHELSTIIEVETPIPGRNTSQLSGCRETGSAVDITNPTPNVGPTDMINADDPNNSTLKAISLLNLEIDNTNVDISPFMSFKEFAKDDNLVIIDDTLVDGSARTDKKALVQKNAECDSDDTLPDIMAEMLKRDLIDKVVNLASKASTGSDSSDSSVYFLEQSSSSGKMSNKINENLLYISGINQILPSSNNSSASENLMNDFEKALQTMGIHWAVSTLKKTKESMALSSTSSSARKDAADNEDKATDNIAKEFSNITGTSVGLSTLLSGLNTPDNSLFQKYAADLSNCSLTKEMNELLNKVTNLKKTQDKTKEGDRGVTLQDIHFSKELVGSVKDKSQHRTSTPVPGGTLSSHCSGSTSTSSRPSNALFSIESDLSSVRNVQKNLTTEDALNVPDMSLKFGKLFDSTNNSTVLKDDL